MAKRCNSCQFRRVQSHCNIVDCNYSLVTGVCRTVLLKDEEMPGEVCPLYVKGASISAKIYKSRGVSRKPEVDYVLVQKLYEAGMFDLEIAKNVHCSKSTIAEWRAKNGLKPNKPNKPVSHIGDFYKELYDRGYTDLEIADAMGRSMSAVRCWRYRERLAPNKKRAEQL